MLIARIKLTLCLLFSVSVTQCYKPLREPPEELVQMAAAMNQRSPIQIGANTRQDFCKVVSGPVFIYYNTVLLNMPEDHLKVASKMMETVIRRNARENPGNEIFRRHRARVIYVYRDLSGREILTVDVGPEGFGAPQVPAF